jgi:hypothetical protein
LFVQVINSLIRRSQQPSYWLFIDGTKTL